MGFDTRDRDIALLNKVVSRYDKVPRLIIVNKKEWDNARGYRANRGITISYIDDSMKVKAIAMVRQGSSANTKMHELGHVYAIEKKNKLPNIGIDDTINEEIKARLFVHKIRGTEFIEHDVIDVFDYLIQKYPQYTLKGIARRLKRILLRSYCMYWFIEDAITEYEKC